MAAMGLLEATSVAYPDEMLKYSTAPVLPQYDNSRSKESGLLVNESRGSLGDMAPSFNDSGTIGGLKIIYEPYELVWTSQVVFRVTMIVVVMVLTIIGNTSLICIIVCHPKLRRKRVNIFLVNLAIGDLMVCFVTMTTEILFVAFGEWVLGGAFCKLVVYGQIVTLASATFMLTGMSIDRYQVIVKPLQSLRGQPKIWRKVVVAWVLALIFAAPQLVIFVQTDEGIHPDGKIKHMCKSRGYTAPWQRKLYFTFLATYILVVPTIIMSYCYTNIIKVVWMRTGDKSTKKSAKRRKRLAVRFNLSTRKEPFGKGCSGSESDNLGSDVTNRLCVPKKLVSASKRNVIKMTLTVIVGFVMCWTPYFVVSLIRIYSNYTIKITDALSVAEIMALVHSALNPILYGMFSTKAARRLCGKLCACCGTGKSSRSPPETMVSEDDTCITGIDVKLHGINHKGNKPCRGSHENLDPPWYERLLQVFRHSLRRKSRKRQRPGQPLESNIPLLIYGRILNGHANATEASTTNQNKAQISPTLPSHDASVSTNGRSRPSLALCGSHDADHVLSDSECKFESPDNLSAGSELQEKGLYNSSMENDSDMVEYLSTL